MPRLLLLGYHVLHFVQSLRFAPTLGASLYSYLSLGIRILDRGRLIVPGELAICGPGAGWRCGGSRTLEVLTLASSFLGVWDRIYHELLSSFSELILTPPSLAEALPIVSLSQTSHFLTSLDLDRFSSIIRSSEQESLLTLESLHHSLPEDIPTVTHIPNLRSPWLEF